MGFVDRTRYDNSFYSREPCNFHQIQVHLDFDLTIVGGSGGGLVATERLENQAAGEDVLVWNVSVYWCNGAATSLIIKTK
jgi:ribulose 1,5-bisphosphate synthetase/thiazole synthase